MNENIETKPKKNVNQLSFWTHYNRPEDPGIVFTEPSMAQQSAAAECDINNIMARYRETGLLSDPFKPARPIQYGDFTEVVDFHTAQNAIASANEAFQRLPAHIRDRFNNDPGQLLSFFDDEKNLEEAIKLGLLAKPAEELSTGQKEPAQAPGLVDTSGSGGTQAQFPT